MAPGTFDARDYRPASEIIWMDKAATDMDRNELLRFVEQLNCCIATLARGLRPGRSA